MGRDAVGVGVGGARGEWGGCSAAAWAWAWIIVEFVCRVSIGGKVGGASESGIGRSAEVRRSSLITGIANPTVALAPSTGSSPERQGGPIAVG